MQVRTNKLYNKEFHIKMIFTSTSNIQTDNVSVMIVHLINSGRQ